MQTKQLAKNDWIKGKLVDNYKSNWFPGHMAKSLKKIKEIVKFIDFWFEIVDARAPLSTQAAGVYDIVKNKPCILVLNRYDLSNERETDRWADYFSKKYLYVLKANSKKNISINFLNSINLDGKKKFRAIVAGVPNVGKSSFINSICHAKKLKVENRAGVTRDLSWISFKNLEICDTPGILPTKLDFPYSKYISYLGLIKSEVLDLEDLSLNLMSDLYKIERSEAIERLSDFARTNGLISKGNVLDLERASILFLKKFRIGDLGRISLEVLDQ